MQQLVLALPRLKIKLQWAAGSPLYSQIYIDISLFALLLHLDGAIIYFWLPTLLQNIDRVNLYLHSFLQVTKCVVIYTSCIHIRA